MTESSNTTITAGDVPATDNASTETTTVQSDANTETSDTPQEDAPPEDEPLAVGGGAAPWEMPATSTLPPVGQGPQTDTPATPAAVTQPGAAYSFKDYQAASASAGASRPGGAMSSGSAAGSVSKLLTPDMIAKAKTINLEGAHDCVVQDITSAANGQALTINVRLKQVDTGDTSGKVTYWLKGTDGMPNYSDIKAFISFCELVGVDPDNEATWSRGKNKACGTYTFKRNKNYLNAYPA